MGSDGISKYNGKGILISNNGRIRRQIALLFLEPLYLDCHQKVPSTLVEGLRINHTENSSFLEEFLQTNTEACLLVDSRSNEVGNINHVGNINWYSRYKNGIDIPEKMKSISIIWCSKPLLGLYPKEGKSLCWRSPCTWMFIEVLFMLAKYGLNLGIHQLRNSFLNYIYICFIYIYHLKYIYIILKNIYIHTNLNII